MSFQADDYYIWHPYFHSTLKPSQAVMPGIYGQSRFVINSKGIRGDELSPAAKYKILALGGSSTECLFLDQEEAWPFLLQRELTRALDEKAWVGNAARSGNTSRHHVLQMEYLLPQFPDIDVVIILTGINDLSLALSRDRENIKQNEDEEGLLASAFSITPLGSKNNLPFYKNTAIWRACKKIRYLIFSAGQGQVIDGRQYTIWRRHRKNASAMRDVLPDMSQALKEYSRNINAIIDLARERGAAVIFITQPVLWRPGLSEELEGLLWLGGVGNFQKEEGKEYYSAGALSKGMDMYNRALLEVCRDRQVECIDLASMLPKDTTVFYDDCHFNESGSQKVSEILTAYMLEHKPFKR